MWIGEREDERFREREGSTQGEGGGQGRVAERTGDCSQSALQGCALSEEVHGQVAGGERAGKCEPTSSTPALSSDSAHSLAHSPINHS